MTPQEILLEAIRRAEIPSGKRNTPQPEGAIVASAYKEIIQAKTNEIEFCLFVMAELLAIASDPHFKIKD